MTAAPSARGPHFLIVGSARSGTTLVQRLACEIPGVGMPPETHFFDLFAPGVLARGPQPLKGARLRAELEQWQRMDEVRGITLDVDALAADVGGSATLVELFGALVRRLAPPATHYGEKTPKHLVWWRPLHRALPALKIIAVVRDPRSVVASNLAAPWAPGISNFDWRGDLHVAMAERWRVEQQQVLELAAEMGSGCLVLRYEDVVADPDTARARIASLLGLDPAPVARAASTRPGTRPAGQPGIVLEWEDWKADALTDVRTDRVAAWREVLSGRRGSAVTAICGRTMRAFGYRPAPTDLLRAAGAMALLHPLTQRRRRIYRKVLRSELDWINGVAL